jgi:hypothetical protein
MKFIPRNLDLTSDEDYIRNVMDLISPNEICIQENDQDGILGWCIMTSAEFLTRRVAKKP